MVMRVFALLVLARCCLGVNQTSHAEAACQGSAVQFRLKRDTNKCLDIKGGQPRDGAQLQIWDCNGHIVNQNFKWCSDGRIVSAANDAFCLDVPGDDPSTPKNLQLWKCNGEAGQYWQYDPADMAIFPPSIGEKMCVDVVGASDSNGALVNIYYCSPGSGEKWYFGQGPPPAPAPPPIPQCSGGKGTVSYFQLNSDTTKCLDIAGGKATKKAGLQIWGCNGGDNQKFIWCNDGRIVSAINDNMCLDVPGGDPSQTSNLQIWPCDRADGQYWMYDGNAMAIYPYKTGEKMCMDVSGGSTSPGTRVINYPCSPGGKWQAQKWQINKAAAETYINV